MEISKLKTGYKETVDTYIEGKLISLFKYEYKINIVDLIQHINELNKKQKFYNSIIGMLFFNGETNSKLIEFELQYFRDCLKTEYYWYA